MLDPLREQILQPDAILARLALPADASLVDVGAGPGFFTPHLARAVPRGRVLATDVRDDYLQFIAERRFPNVTTRRVPPDDPELAPRSADLVLLCQVDHLLRDRADYFKKLAPALRAGGRLVLINLEDRRAAAVAAAEAAGYRAVDEWRPSAGFYVLVLARGRR
jgi:trans-aconitate methyltransferase